MRQLSPQYFVFIDPENDHQNRLMKWYKKFEWHFPFPLFIIPTLKRRKCTIDTFIVCYLKYNYVRNKDKILGYCHNCEWVTMLGSLIIDDYVWTPRMGQCVGTFVYTVNENFAVDSTFLLGGLKPKILFYNLECRIPVFCFAL